MSLAELLRNIFLRLRSNKLLPAFLIFAFGWAAFFLQKNYQPIENFITANFILSWINFTILGATLILVVVSSKSRMRHLAIWTATILSIGSLVELYPLWSNFTDPNYRFSKYEWIYLRLITYSTLCLYIAAYSFRNIAKIKAQKISSILIDPIAALTLLITSLWFIDTFQFPEIQHSKFTIREASLAALCFFTFIASSMLIKRFILSGVRSYFLHSIAFMAVPLALTSSLIFVGIGGIHSNLFTLVFCTNILTSILPLAGIILDFQKSKELDKSIFLKLENEILERKRVEMELQATVRDVQAANKTKSLFLANMSHELRTPLNAIIGYSELLMEDAQDDSDENLLNDLDKINRSGKHLLRLINDVLDLSKIEAGKLELSLVDFDVTELITEVKNTIFPLISRNGNELIIELDPKIKIIHNDHLKLRQCMLNLLSNASKFTENGVITLNAELKMQSGKEHIVFKVIDTGIGMPEDTLDKIFQSFIQIDNSATKKFEGTGLGLAITKRIANLMGGYIKASSKINEGSTFELGIPTKIGDEALLPSDKKPEGTKSSEVLIKLAPSEISLERQYNVLIVDQDSETRDLIEESLNEQNIGCHGASNGVDAIQIAKKMNINLIIIDFRLPLMNGEQVISIFKNNPTLKQIPIIVMTVLENPKEIMELGATDFINKPLSVHELTSKINAIQASEEIKGSFAIYAETQIEKSLLTGCLASLSLDTQLIEHVENINEHVKSNKPDVAILNLANENSDSILNIVSNINSYKHRPYLVLIGPAKMSLKEISRYQKKCDLIYCKGEIDFQKNMMPKLKQYLISLDNIRRKSVA